MSGIQVELCNVQDIEKASIIKENLDDIEKNSDSIALSVLNDIVDNALDSVLNEEIEGKPRYITTVGDIMGQYTPRATKITELSDNLGKQKPSNLTPTEEEIKKFVSELSTNAHPSKGTGDQLQEKEEIITKKKSLPFSARKFSLEKKTRLTDLVRTSKSVISKFLSNDVDSKQNENEWEEHSETFVKSIELDKINSDKEKPNSNAIPDEANMENINLNDLNDKDSLPEQNQDKLDFSERSKTFPIACSSRLLCHESESKECRKKWNFGSKIVNYIKKKASRRDITKME